MCTVQLFQNTCLEGFLKCLVEFLFLLTQGETGLHAASQALIVWIKDLDIAPRKPVFNTHKNIQHLLSFTAIFAVLKIFDGIFCTLTVSISTKAFSLLEMCSRHVSLTYWWTRIEVDGVNSYELVFGSFGKIYFEDLYDLSSLYGVDELKYFFSSSNDRKRLDPSNIYWIQELYNHTKPMFEHALFVFKLIFEVSHKPIKLAISK